MSTSKVTIESKRKISTVSIHTLGCKLNFSESSYISKSLEDNDFKIVEFNEYADVYEVFLAIMKAHGVDEDDVLKAKIEKVITNGSFSDGLLLKD